MPRLPLLLLLLLPLAADAQPRDLPDAVTERLERLVASGQVEGVLVGVLDADGARTYGFGRLAAERTEAPDGETIFEIGSITKAYTGVLLAEMVERGEVSLDDPIGRFLPEGVAPGVRDRITLGHLADHTSGLPRLPANLVPADPGNPYAAYTVENLYAFLSGHTLRREPGAQYEYSNLGAGLLGHLLALHVGTDYEALLRERVLAPLDLDDTAVTLTPEQRQRLAPGHDQGRPAANWTFPTLAGAGALHASGDDLLRFLAAYLDPTGPLAEPLAHAAAPRAEAGEGMAVGLGWHVRTTPDATIVWHNGGTGGYRSFAGFDRDRQRAVVVLTNATLGLDAYGFHLLDPALPLPEVRVPVALAEEVLDRYPGAYQLAPGFLILVTREGASLYAQATGQQPFRLLPLSETRFAVPVAGAEVSFRVGAGGEVEGLTLHQGGHDQFGPRVEY